MALSRWWRGIFRSPRPVATLLSRTRLKVESCEDRVTPATFNIANNDIAALSAAITTSNSNAEPDVINLAVSGTYTFTTAFNTANQLALPTITSDNADILNTLTINGNGSTFTRGSSTLMRYLFADSSATPATVIVNDLTMTNAASTFAGGAVVLDGSNGTFSNCTFTLNGGAGGGAIVALSTTNVTLTLTNCVFDNNSSSGVGGAVAVQGTYTVQITGSTVTANASNGSGGGLWIQGTDLTISDSVVRGNQASGATSTGGGIFVSGNLVFSNGQIADNISTSNGGGALCLGSASITNSSITGNNATGSAAGGGGLAVQTDINVFQSTIDGNRAGAGGGILIGGSSNGSITHSTITRNKAFGTDAEGAGLFFPGTNPIQMGNTIVAENTFEAAATNTVGPDISGPIVSLGYNLIGVADGATITGTLTGNKTGTAVAPLNPLLGALANYGGTTLTRSILPGSPALDAGNPSFLPPPDFDQRGTGFPRVIGGRIDIGALEAPQVDLTIVKTDNVNSAVPGQSVTYTIVVTNKGPQDAIGAVVRDILDPALTNVSWSAIFSGGSTGNASGSGTLLETVNMPINGQIFYTLTATINPSATGSLVNTAIVDTPPGYSDPVADNTSTDTNILTPVADAFVTKVITGTPTPGGTVVYTITVGNLGPSTVTSLRLQDVFPTVIVSANWTSVVSGIVVGNSISGSGNIDQILTVHPGATVTYSVTARINPDAPGGTVTNTAKITPPDIIGDPNTDNNTSTSSVFMIVGQQLTAFGADAGGLPIVKVYNPLSGSIRMQFSAYGAGFRGGVRIAVGDFNGDGTQDIVTAAGPGGGPHIRVFDGTNGVVLWEFFAYEPTFSGGVFVAAGDVNNDGRMDIITGAGAGGGPHVRVFDGLTHFLVPGDIGDFFAYDAGFHGGVHVAAGDINGDGLDDVITGAGAGGGPHVKVFSGANRDTLMSFFAYDSRFSGGVFVTAGDFNNDGRKDIVTGAGQGGGPHVRFFDGASGNVFREFFAYPTNSGGLGSNSVWSSGVRVSAQVDVTGDGFDDFYVAPGSGRNSNARLFSGANLGLAREGLIYDPSFLGGVFVGGA